MEKYNGDKYLKVLKKEIKEFGIVPANVIALIRLMSIQKGYCFAESKSLSAMLGLKGRGGVEYHLKNLVKIGKVINTKIEGKRALYITGEYNPEIKVSEPYSAAKSTMQQPDFDKSKEYYDSNGVIQKKKPNPFGITAI